MDDRQRTRRKLLLVVIVFTAILYLLGGLALWARSHVLHDAPPLDLVVQMQWIMNTFADMF